MSESRVVPVQYVPMTEIAAGESIDEALQRLLRKQIPAFVLRCADRPAATYEDALRSRAANLSRLRKGLLDIFPYKQIEEVHADVKSQLSALPIGRLHTDMQLSYEDEKHEVMDLEVHTTGQGSGNVLMAAMGSRPERVFGVNEYRPTSSASIISIPHDQLLSDGTVDPELIHPEFHVTHVVAGDSIVHSSSGTHATWHRFDSDPMQEYTRLAMFTQIEDVTPDETLYSDSGYYRGFELPA